MAFLKKYYGRVYNFYLLLYRLQLLLDNISQLLLDQMEKIGVRMDDTLQLNLALALGFRQLFTQLFIKLLEKQR